MALKINARCGSEFNAAINLQNDILLGDPGESNSFSSDLQGDIATDTGRADRYSMRDVAGAGTSGAARASPTGAAGPAPGEMQPPAGSQDTDAAIREGAAVAGADVNTMRGIASIESGMNPASNASRRTQYKGLYQIGREEWRRYGSGNIYNARDNAAAAGRMFAANKMAFRARFGRDPTDRELYMMHQQGLGFYTRGAMTNIGGNPYPGMRGPQSHSSFEAGWGRELERRARAFRERESAGKPGAATVTAPAGKAPTPL